MAKIADVRFMLWAWWRGSDVNPDLPYLNMKALRAKVLWLQDQLDAAMLENRQLRERLAKDDYLLGRPTTERSTDGVHP